MQLEKEERTRKKTEESWQSLRIASEEWCGGLNDVTPMAAELEYLVPAGPVWETEEM